MCAGLSAGNNPKMFLLNIMHQETNIFVINRLIDQESRSMEAKVDQNERYSIIYKYARYVEVRIRIINRLK